MDHQQSELEHTRGWNHRNSMEIAKAKRFRIFKQFNDPDFALKVDCRDRLRKSDTRWFPGEYLSSEFARALCEQRAIPFKEVLESFEFYGCVRKQVRAPDMADLCCGHGLVGVIFAMFERQVQRVVLLDRKRPDSHDLVLNAARAVAPWVEEKLSYVQDKTEAAAAHLVPGTSILGVHACGERTDQCIEHAIRLDGPLAVLPCCRHHRSSPAPVCLQLALGGDLALDVDRTYRLHQAGYHVRWDAIPESITPMCRVLVGQPRDRHPTETR